MEILKLELKNFEHAGEILAELGSKLNLGPSDITIIKSEEWKANHVRESQYILPIVKCTDTACCSPFQSPYLKIMKDRFLPPPLPVVFSSTGIEWAKDDTEATYLGNPLPKHVSAKFPRGITYDYSCPLTKDVLMERVCTHGGLYFGSIKSKQNHSPNCR